MRPSLHRSRAIAPAWSLLMGAIASALIGCGGATEEPATANDAQLEVASPKCREDVGDDIEMGLKTAGQAVEAGAETGVAGVKQAGQAVGGFLYDGPEGAKAGWNDGKSETKSEAREGRDEVRDEASLPPCPEREP